MALDGMPEDGADTRRGGYATDRPETDHPDPLRVGPVLCLAVGVVLAVWTAQPGVAVLAAALAGMVTRSWWVVLVAGALCIGGIVRSDQAWTSLAPDALGAYEGWARLVDDPQTYPGGTRVILELDGERFEAWTRGRARARRVQSWHGGEWVAVSGMRSSLDAERAHRVAWQHVVGDFEIDWASDVDPGNALARASNRVRAAIERAGSHMPGDDGSLYRGLVVGDDRDEPRDMIERFRASGLSHLTAVSGQNVSFLLAAAGPVITRLRPWARWVVTLGLIAWFVVLTRFEPSIVRAGTMAGLSATAFVLGRDRSPVRILGVAVIALVLLDPLLVWSVGFWLSVGATLGVSSVGPWLAARFATIDRTRLFALPLGVTLGAQLGVAVPSVLVFGRLPLVSIPANLLAVPVAGAVMLYGMPAGLVAGWVPPVAPIVMFPVRTGTRWIDTIARLGERLEPSPRVGLVGWAVVATIVVVVLFSISRHTARIHGDLPADR